MFGFTTLRARQLSRNGEHAAALAMCRIKDPYVLSRAGMHLSVLDVARKPSFEHAVALAQVGAMDAALEMANAGHFKNAHAKTLFGYLATQAPDRILPIVIRQPDWHELQAYCAAALGETGRAISSIHQLSALHAFDVAMHAGQPDLARSQFVRLFEEMELAVPEVDWSSGRMEFLSLSGAARAAAAAAGPLVSVILTAHNEESLLPCAVASILNQDWSNLELLLVDDGSTDRTLQVAQGLAERDRRIRVLRLQENAGTWAAKNLALQEARGSFITMHDADDWSHPAKLSQQIRPLLDDPDIICTSSYFFRVAQDSGLPFTRNANAFLRWNPSSLMFRREVLQRVGVYRDKLLGGDCEFAGRLETCWGAACHARIRKPLAIGLHRAASLSNKSRTGRDGEVRLRHWQEWRLAHVEMYLARNKLANWARLPAKQA